MIEIITDKERENGSPRTERRGMKFDISTSLNVSHGEFIRLRLLADKLL